MNKINSLSIIFPCYNDARTIGNLIAIADKIAKKITDKHEIIVVNDGSSDSSPNILSDLQNKYLYLTVVTHEKNMGYGATIWHGLKIANYDYIFYTDGDGQYDPSELLRLAGNLGENTILINGYKSKRQDAFYRVLIGNIYKSFIKLLFNIKLRDVDCDFRLIKKDVLDKIDVKERGGTMCLELVKKLERLGGEIKEVPVSHYARKYGRSQFFKLKNLLIVFIDIPKLFFTLGR